MRPASGSAPTARRRDAILAVGAAVRMKAIFRGRRYVVIERTTGGVWLEPWVPSVRGPRHVHVTVVDPDLILDPTAEDLGVAQAFERGEIDAFAYVDGHCYPRDPSQDLRARHPGAQLPPRRRIGTRRNK